MPTRCQQPYRGLFVRQVSVLLCRVLRRKGERDEEGVEEEGALFRREDRGKVPTAGQGGAEAAEEETEEEQEAEV